MKSKLIGFLKAKYKDNKDIKFLDGKGKFAEVLNNENFYINESLSEISLINFF